MDVQQSYAQWLKDFASDPETVAELESIRGNDAEIEDRFYTELSFGTAGMRGVLGAGTNRMNVYTVGMATQGLANYLKKNFAGVQFDFVCCVPLSESSLKRRGYNQSALLAKEIAKELGMPFEEKLLSRPFQGKEQKTLGGIERFGGVIGAFDCAENKITENAAVLLCDDISTTGATLNECAKLLLLRGADKVYCVSAAITKKEDGKCSEQTSE